MRLRPALLSLGAVTALVLPLTATAAVADSHGASVTVVHGVPGVPVDIWVDGEPAIPGFQPGATQTVSGLSGSLQVEIVPAGQDRSAAVITQSVDVPSSGSYDLVAHLNEGGEPVLTTFDNSGDDNVIVRHTAAAPAVDVLVDGEAALTGLTNPNQESATLPAGSYQVAVALTGETDPVLGPITLEAAADETYTAYAVGSAAENTLDVILVTGSDREAADGGGTPGRVDAGSGGLAADGAAAALVPALVLGALLMTGGAVAFARR
jgi:hypothetical protein